MVNIIYIVIAIRVLTQMFGGDEGYFAGVHLFDTSALLLLGYYMKGIDRSLMFFFAGCAFFNLIKPLYTDPTINDPYEVYFCLSGLVFIFVEYVYKRVNTRYRG